VAEKHGPQRLGDIARTLGAHLFGDEDILIEKPLPAGSSDPRGITFAGDEKYLAKALSGEIGAIIVARGTGGQKTATLEVDNPRAAFGMVLAMFDRTMSLPPGIHPTAVVPDRLFDVPGVRVGPHAVIEDSAEIHSGAQIMAGCYVGPRSVVGENTILFPHVTLYHDVIVGARCRIHSGTVLGADGFGYAFVGGMQRKVPQVGRVVLGDDVEIGANSCIDRATCGDTLIENDVKLDNMVQIAHNCRVGAHTVMASQVGISGSVDIGDRCMFGGQAGVTDHVSIAAGSAVIGQSGVMSNLDSGEWIGSPAQNPKAFFREQVLIRRLPEMSKSLKRLEQQVQDLTSGS
jgi:UDP-3-O-[3-hydroxymyristoyl] glucosamine N-acyltransferase